MFTESIQFDSRLQVDRDKHLIRGITLSGPKSRNKRRYSEAARRDIVRLSEGKSVDVTGHISKGGKGRQPLDCNGKLQNVHLDAEGMVRGDWQLLPNHNSTHVLLDIAELNPSAAMLSHEVRKGDWEDAEDGWIDVSSAEEMSHYALVSEGGITKSLFESKGDEPVPKPTIAELKEQLTNSEVKELHEVCCGGTKGLEDKLAAALSDNEKLKKDLKEAQDKLKVHEDLQQEVEDRKAISEQAKKLVGESYVVPDELMDSLLILDESNREAVLKNCTLTEGPPGEDPPADPDDDPPRSRGGARSGGLTSNSFSRLVTANRRF